MEKLSPNTKKTSAWKAFGGGIAALGIFASLLVLGSFDFSETKTLQAEVLATDAPIQTTTTTATITLLSPATGEAGDLVQLTVENLENFDKATSAVYLGANTAKIITVKSDEENKTVLTVQVPPLITADYVVRIVTPTGMTESAQKFILLATVESTAIPSTVDLPTSTEINLENFENFSKTGSPATSFENNFEETAPTSSPGISTIVAPPQNLTVNSSSTGIQLSWQKPTTGKAEKFNIYYGSQSGNYLHRVESENFTEIISQNLEDGEIYFFTIKSVDAFGNESPASAEISAIFAAKSVENPTSNFYSAVSHPPQLSEQGPAAGLAIAFLITLAFTLLGFRKKIWAGK
jgi:hypothetical protein